MRKYELVLVLKTSLSEAQRKKVIDTFKSWLKDAKFTKEEEWGQKALAYPINKEVSGYYVDFVVELENIPSDFEKRVQTNEDVLRHLLVRVK